MKITKAFVTSDGQAFQDASEAQIHEIKNLLEGAKVAKPVGEELTTESAAIMIVNNKDKVIDWLTTKGTSRPAARKVNGASRKRGQKAAEATTTAA